MLDDFAVVIQPEDIDACPITIARPLLITMENDIAVLGNHPLEVNALAGVFLCHAHEIRDEGFLAIGHSRIVLNVDLTGVAGDGFGRLLRQPMLY